MKAKKIIILFMVFNTSIIAQQSNLEIIKNHYRSINLFEKIEELYSEYSQMWREINDTIYSWGLQIDTVYQNLIRQKTMQKIRNEHSVVFLYPKIRNAEKFRFSKNIYDFITIDINRTRIIHFNEQEGKFSVLDRETLRSSTYSGRKKRKLKHFFQFINEKMPDALLMEGVIFRDACRNNTNYLFLKDDKIFVYRTENGNVYELNRFIRRFFDEKDFVRRAILAEQGLVLVGD